MDSSAILGITAVILTSTIHAFLLCFTCDRDIAACAHCTQEGATQYGVAAHGWIVMINSVRLVPVPATDQGVSKNKGAGHYIQVDAAAALPAVVIRLLQSNPSCVSSADKRVALCKS